jgi:hypothetical protein
MNLTKDARDALGQHIGKWLSDCRLQWTLRYRPTPITTEGGGENG